MIVIDASAALEFVLKTAAGAKIDARIFQPGETLHAPHLIDVEVAHVLRRMAASGVPAAFCEAALRDWLDTRVRRYPHDVLLDRVWELRANFTAYDAAYLALAESLGANLLTHDRKLASRSHNAVVELI